MSRNMYLYFRIISDTDIGTIMLKIDPGVFNTFTYDDLDNLCLEYPEKYKRVEVNGKSSYEYSIMADIYRACDIEYEYPQKEEKHNRRAEKALFSFHGNKYRNMSNYSKKVHRVTNRNLIRNRNDI